MSESVLVFISHSSSDKASLVEPIVKDLEDCYLNVWLDKRKILPGENLRKSIFQDGLDKADIVLIFFTGHSLKSAWVDKEIKHVLREDLNKKDNFSLRKIISIFDSETTYNQISERYPELTDDLLHLMPENYSKIELGKLISAVWSKYFSLKGEDIETQKKILQKDREIFKLERDVEKKRDRIKELESSEVKEVNEFLTYFKSGKTDSLLNKREIFLTKEFINSNETAEFAESAAFGLLKIHGSGDHLTSLTDKGRNYLQWYILDSDELDKLR